MKIPVARLHWIDTLKAIGIFLVLLGHQLGKGPLVYYIYAFHVPLFFLISGYLFDYEKYRDLKYFLRHKIRTLLIPYFCFATISYLFWLIVIRSLSIRGQSLAMDPIKPFIGIFYAIGVQGWQLPLNIALWFIPCLFITEIMFWIFRTTINRDLLLYLSLVIMGTIGFVGSQVMHIRLPWSIDVAFSAIVFYGFGYFLKSKKINVFTFSNNSKRALFLIILLIVHIKMALLNGKADMNANYYGNILYFYIAALSGAGFYMILSPWIPQNLITTFIGKNTIIIMGLSGNVLFIILGLTYFTSKSLGVLTSSGVWISVLYSILQIGFMFPVIYITNKYFPYLIGRNQRV